MIPAYVGTGAKGGAGAGEARESDLQVGGGRRDLLNVYPDERRE